MEKDIEILESFIKQLEEFEDEEELKQALENLINRVKELEEKQKKLKQEKLELIKEKNVVHFSDVQEELTSMRDALDIKQAEMNMQNEIITTCYIPKSKIKEKIEEVNKRENVSIVDVFESMKEYAIQVLQELLEE